MITNSKFKAYGIRPNTAITNNIYNVIIIKYKLLYYKQFYKGIWILEIFPLFFPILPFEHKTGEVSNELDELIG
ncbi:hypothetical protein RIR_jg28518.t1 [Rhizophagus irregularis DAOM 181602=DAOM 197198]|nr:hypothetical protein RIR_jg28518.t1 [Rhizophagus irregularis DAOM 181602=DAOM 197198]